MSIISFGRVRCNCNHSRLCTNFLKLYKMNFYASPRCKEGSICLQIVLDSHLYSTLMYPNLCLTTWADDIYQYFLDVLFLLYLVSTFYVYIYYKYMYKSLLTCVCDLFIRVLLKFVILLWKSSFFSGRFCQQTCVVHISTENLNYWFRKCIR